MVAIASTAFVIAFVCAALMGFSIQRGATCTVAAVGEIVRRGTTNRLVALAEASLWVAGGLALAHVIGLLPNLPPGFPVNIWTFVGGALLGLGAYINGACVFGAIARLGSGQIAYILSPVGFYLGSVTTTTLFHPEPPMPLVSAANGWVGSPWLALLLGTFAIWRLFVIVRRPAAAARNWRSLWAPHEATLVIGVTFVILILAVGDWAYTTTLADVARGMDSNIGWQALLLFALFLGAFIGGLSTGQFQIQRPQASVVVRCLVGGAMMGWGSILIPGSNDGLILIGMPLLWPYAWLAVATMAISIWAAMRLELRLTKA